MKILFYCQSSLGVGHLSRTYKLAGALVEKHAVTVVCGGHVSNTLQAPDGVRVERIPAISMSAQGELLPGNGLGSIDSVRREREQRLVKVAEQIQPDMLITEMFPFGRRQFASEIIGLIETVRRVGAGQSGGASGARVLASVRDVLVSRREKQAAIDAQAVQWLNAYFDGLLIHSDESVISLAETFSAYDRIKVPTYYTGFVAANPGKRVVTPDPVIVVSAGGGLVGEKLIQTAKASAALLAKSLGMQTLIITGPNYPEEADEHDQHYRLIRFVTDLPGLLARSALSISQCGYNTATDVLVAQVPAVFVPYEAPREDEQMRRAQVLSACKRAVCVPQSELTPAKLLTAAREALKLSTTITVDLDGISKSAKIIGAIHGS